MFGGVTLRGAFTGCCGPLLNAPKHRRRKRRRPSWPRLLAEQGRLDELRDRADARDKWAAGWLADLLGEQGRLDELRDRADARDK